MAQPTDTAHGRRERNMQEKRGRIFRAASDLFAEHGYAQVSTSAVSQRADVATGTVFRYAASKGELLLMVLNEQLREVLQAGAARAEQESSTTEAVLAMVRPLITYATDHPENGVAYQRELLFGDATDRYRAEGLAIIVELQERIARRLIDDAHARGLEPDTDLALLTATMVFSVIHLAIVRSITGTHPGRDPHDDIRAQVGLAVDGYHTAITRPSNADAPRSSEPRR